MPAPTPIVFTVTEAGRLAALSAESTGLSLKLVTLRASNGKTTPTGTETSLPGTLRGSWALGGGSVEPTSKTLRFFALVQSTITLTDIFSLGLFTESGTLFAIASTTGSTPLLVVNANIDFLPSFGVRLPAISASSITIETDPNAPLAMSLMNSHQTNSHPHPQYLKIDDVETLKPLYLQFLQMAYPVGTPYFNKADARNPREILGFGTWAREEGRVLVGQSLSDSSFTVLGTTGGEKTHGLTEAELPSVSKSVTINYQPRSPSESAGGVVGNASYLDGTGSSKTLTLSFGGGQAHNNLQPFVVYAWWVRTA